MRSLPGCPRIRTRVSTDCTRSRAPTTDFYGIQAPVDPRASGGRRSTWSTGFADRRPSVPVAPNATDVEVLAGKPQVVDIWRGVDTNVTLRMRGGLRISGGAGTGITLHQLLPFAYGQPERRPRRRRDPVGKGASAIVSPTARSRRTCAAPPPLRFPWVDLLVSAAFSWTGRAWRWGPTYQFGLTHLVWLPGSQDRATNTQGVHDHDGREPRHGEHRLPDVERRAGETDQ